LTCQQCLEFSAVIVLRLEKDNLSLGAQIFNLSNKDVKAKIEKWLTGYCFDKNGEAMSLQKAMDDDWNIVDLKNFLKKLCDLSG
jgi:hypothetical protein